MGGRKTDERASSVKYNLALFARVAYFTATKQARLTGKKVSKKGRREGGGKNEDVDMKIRARKDHLNTSTRGNCIMCFIATWYHRLQLRLIGAKNFKFQRA